MNVFQNIPELFQEIQAIRLLFLQSTSHQFSLDRVRRDAMATTPFSGQEHATPTGTVTREEFRRHMRNDTMVPFGCIMLQLETDDFI